MLPACRTEGDGFAIPSFEVLPSDVEGFIVDGSSPALGLPTILMSPPTSEIVSPSGTSSLLPSMAIPAGFSLQNPTPQEPLPLACSSR